jgi:transcriptional regulator of acetoin/glycerol metabolism
MQKPTAQRAAAAHDYTRADGTLPAGALSAMIEDSWKRSQSYGLSETQRPEFDPMPRADLEEACESARQLMMHARPVMETLYEQIVDTQSMVVLTDSTGVILHSLGDDDFLRRAEKVALKPGVVWSEQSKGTNAIGTAIAEEAPAVVHGPEHFLSANHFLTCSATPIADPRGDTIGVLDVSGDSRNFHRHTLALVRMSGQLIENQLFTNAFPDAALIYFHTRPEFVGTLCEGMIAFRPDGSILSANKSALFQLATGRAGLSTHTFSSLFGVPVSTVFDHARTRGFDLLPLTMHTGVRVMARVRMGTALKPLLSAFSQVSAQSADAATSAPQRPAAAQEEHGSGLKKLTLEALKTGDPQVDSALSKIHKVLGRNISILIQGETGTGKELVARAIHNDSPRRDGPFIAVNCASIPDGLIESELFGYEEGAFTGARKKGGIGKIMLANGGTLFLDEIGDMPQNLQARLLRVLQERVVMPLGSAKSYPVDVAIICATNRRLKEMIARGLFREDLYYRLNGLLINLPPLRVRSDLATVVDRILHRELKAPPQARVAEEVLELFRRHPWPGNLRQLANLLRTALVMVGEDQVIRREHLPDDFLEDLELGSEHEPLPQAPLGPSCPLGEGGLEEMEISAIQKTLEQTGGNVSATARRLGISRNTIYRKLKTSMGLQ